MWSWGYNGYGQLGIGNTTDTTIRTQVGTDTDWSTIEASFDNSIALKTNQKCYAWGRNNYGQLLGDGTLVNKNIPTQVEATFNWKQITIGLAYTMAIKSDNSLWGWGLNDYGQLGNGTVTNGYLGAQIGTAVNWSQISAGRAHTLAMKTDNTLWAWGRNDYGQLGVGTFVDTTVRTQVGTDTWFKVTSGSLHTVAIKSDGTLWTWGFNNNGQLGDGTTTNKNIPIFIICPTSLAVQDQNQVVSQFLLYPNPITNNTFSIQSKNTIISVVAFDFLGKQIDIEKIDSFYKIQAASGIYTIKIIDSDGNSQFKKLIIN